MLQATLALLAATLGVGLLVAAVLTGRSQFAVLHEWPVVEAEVEESALFDARNDLVYRSGQSVVFRYRVEGVEYTSTAALDSISGSYRVRRELGERYAPGSIHMIRHDPADPGRVRFEVAPSVRFYIAPIVLVGSGLLFLVIGVVNGIRAGH